MGLQVELANLATSLSSEGKSCKISPQVAKKLSRLLDVDCERPDGLKDVCNHLKVLFRRMLLELVQAHYNTAQREQQFMNLVEKKGCTISNPSLTDAVISALVKLYKASQDCLDSSFERKTLIDFLTKDLDSAKFDKKQISRVFQTLYRCSCFHIKHGTGEPARFELKDELHQPSLMRRQHDVELIKMAQEEKIRLSLNSWTHLLYRGSWNADYKGDIKSILDSHQSAVTVNELETTIHKMSDKYDIVPVLAQLKYIEDTLDNSTEPSLERICEVIGILSDMTSLFTIRQDRRRQATQQ